MSKKCKAYSASKIGLRSCDSRTAFYAGWEAAREALEAAPEPAAVEQGPVGFMNAGHLCELENRRIPYGYVYPSQGTGADVPLYAAPQPAHQPLTDKQIDSMVATASLAERDMFRRFARAIERAHGIGGEE